MLPKKTEGAGKLPSGLLDQEIEERTDVNSLRRMIEMLPQIAFVGTRDGSAVYFNQYWHNYAGISRDAAGVDLWTPAIHPDDLDRSLAEWRRAAETGREHSGEYRVHRAADGQFRWHQVHSVPVKDPSGQITAWLSTALDVHQQKTAEEELRESEARLRAILHAEPECVKTLSLQGLIVEINPAGLAMIEADSAQQLLGKPIFDVVCEPYRASMERLYKSVLAGQTGNLDFEIIGLKGTRRYLRTHATPLRDHSGTIVSMLSISQDITERKKAEDALRDNEARFRALIENSSSVILLFDSAWNVIYSSTPRHPILGYNAEEARKVKVLDLCHPDDRSSLYEAGKKCVKNPGVPVVATVRLRGKDGVWRTVELTLTNWLQSPDIAAIVGNYSDVTERMQAEEALRLTRFSVEKAADAIFWVGPDAKILDVNDSACRILKYSRAELLQKTVHDIDPNFPAEAWPAHWQELRERRSFSFETTHRTKDGDTLVTETSVNHLEFGGKEYNCAFMRDISDRKRAEEALQLSEDKFKRAFAASPDAIAITRIADGRYLEINEALERLSGYRREELVGHTALELKIWMDEADRQKMFRSLAEHGRVKAMETQFRTKDGTAFPIMFSAELMEVRGEKCLLSISRDLRDLRLAEQELRRSEEHNRSVIENAPYGICRTVPAGRIVMANPALVRMLGYETAQEVLGLDIEKDVYRNPEDRQRLMAMAYRRVPAEWPFATVWKRKDGLNISVRLAGRAILDEKQQPAEFEVFVEDVTKQEALENQLRIAQKMEAVGELAGGVAHDFNNLLMIIGSRAEMILENSGDSRRATSQAEAIMRATDRGAALTGQLLAFSRKQVLQPTMLNLNEVLLEMERMLPRLIGENIDTAVITSSRIGRVRVDRGQFDQVIMNLAINARDAMPQGGKLVIETSPANLTEDFAAAHPGVTPGPYVLLTVQDSGIGMDLETQARIFEPFFTTKERGRGTGLGLAMVYGMVKQSGGCITVTSALGQGTTFHIYLPEIQEPGGDAGTEESLQTPTGSETILLVEDEEALRTVCAGFLRDKGYKVIEAANGAEAVNICAKQRPIDLLVTDVIMPGMNGLELSQKARAMHLELRIIFTSGYSDKVIDPETLPATDAYLKKPFSMANLAKQVRETLDR